MNPTIILSRTRPLVGIIGVAFWINSAYVLDNRMGAVLNRRDRAIEMLSNGVADYSNSERIRLNKEASQDWCYGDASLDATVGAFGGVVCLASLAYSAKSSRIVGRWKRRRDRYKSDGDGIEAPGWLFRII